MNWKFWEVIWIYLKSFKRSDGIALINSFATISITLTLALIASSQKKIDSESAARAELSKTLQIIIERKGRAGLIHFGGDFIINRLESPEWNNPTLADFKFNMTRSHLGWMRSTEVLARHAIVQTKKCEELVTPYDYLVISSALFDSGNPTESLKYAEDAMGQVEDSSLNTDNISEYERDNVRLQVYLHSARVYFSIHNFCKGKTNMEQAEKLITHNKLVSAAEKYSLSALVYLLWADFQAPLVGLENSPITDEEVYDHLEQAEQKMQKIQIREGELNARLQQLYEAVNDRVNRVLDHSCKSSQLKIPCNPSMENSPGMVHLDFEVQRDCRLSNQILVMGKIKNTTKNEYRIESISIVAFDKEKNLLGWGDSLWFKHNELKPNEKLDVKNLTIELLNVDSSKVAAMEWKMYGKIIKRRKDPKIVSLAPADEPTN